MRKNISVKIRGTFALRLSRLFKVLKTLYFDLKQSEIFDVRSIRAAGLPKLMEWYYFLNALA
jgi:hypothetical protein